MASPPRNRSCFRDDHRYPSLVIGRRVASLASRHDRTGIGDRRRRLLRSARLLLCLAIAAACTNQRIVCNCPAERAPGVQISMFPWLHTHGGAASATACALNRCSTTQLSAGNNDAFIAFTGSVTAPTNVTVTLSDLVGQPVLIRDIRVRPQQLTDSCCGHTTRSSFAQLTLEGNGTLADTTVRRS